MRFEERLRPPGPPPAGGSLPTGWSGPPPDRSPAAMSKTVLASTRPRRTSSLEGMTSGSDRFSRTRPWSCPGVEVEQLGLGQGKATRVALADAGDAGAGSLDDPRALMPGDGGRPGRHRPGAVSRVDVGVAGSRRPDPDHRLAGSRPGRRNLLRRRRLGADSGAARSDDSQGGPTSPGGPGPHGAAIGPRSPGRRPPPPPRWGLAERRLCWRRRVDGPAAAPRGTTRNDL